MKHYSFLFLMICFCPFYVMGQDNSSVKMTELTDESQLVDGGIYIMTGYADNQYFGSQYKLFNASYYFSSGIKEGNSPSTNLVTFFLIAIYCVLNVTKMAGMYGI